MPTRLSTSTWTGKQKIEVFATRSNKVVDIIERVLYYNRLKDRYDVAVLVCKYGTHWRTITVDPKTNKLQLLMDY